MNAAVAQRPANSWQQFGIGFAGIALAAVLVVGQIAVSTTRGIQKNLHDVVGQMDQGNGTIKEILAKSTYTPKMEKTIAHQAQVLITSRDALVALNAEMAAIDRHNKRLLAATSAMRKRTKALAISVGQSSTDSAAMQKLLADLDTRTVSTAKHISKIEADSGAINVELGKISNKMTGYGLPVAQKVQR